MPPPPRTTRADTPYPYTTLFRAHGRGACRPGRPQQAAEHQRDQQVGKRQQQRGGEQPGLQVLLRALLIEAGGGTHRQAAERRQGGHEGAQIVRLRSEEHTSELQSLMRISYAVFCLKKKKKKMIHL